MVLLAYDKIFGTEFVDIGSIKADRINRPRFRKYGEKSAGEAYKDWIVVNGFGSNDPELVRSDPENALKEGHQWIRAMEEEAERLILHGEYPAPK
jgi:hypothetical protein